MDSAQRIVVGVDGSAAGQRALAWAVREAAAHGASVHLVTAFGFTPLDASNLRYRAAQRQAVERWLTGLVARTRTEQPGVEVTGRAVVGPAADVLSAACADADLLVLGSHGHARLAAQVFGSVAGHCIRTAACPVVVVPGPVEEHRHGAVPEARAGTGVPAGLL